MEEQGQNHPMFANRGENTNNEDNNNSNEWAGNPWAQGFPAMPNFGGGFPFRGRHGHGPPQGSRGPFQQPFAEPETNTNNEKEGEAGPSDAAAPPTGQQTQEGPSTHGPGPQRGHGCGGRSRGRGPWGNRGGRHHGFPGGAPGPQGLPGMMGGAMGGFGALANMFQEQLFGEEGATKEQNDDFKPDVDVFDTPEAFVVHVSLPGAKKEDVGVNWDAEKSELSIAGVVYRPGDEEFLQTLAMNERKIGAFERKVRLGSRANPAAVDVDGITARMQDGVLSVEVPKLDSGYVEVKKVDIE